MLKRSRTSSSTTSTVSPALVASPPLLLIARLAQQSSDLLDQFAQVVRFGEESIGKVVDRFGLSARTDDALDPRKARMGKFRQRDAVHLSRHADIGEQQMHRQRTLQNGQGFVRIGS